MNIIHATSREVVIVVEAQEAGHARHLQVRFLVVLLSLQEWQSLVLLLVTLQQEEKMEVHWVSLPAAVTARLVVAQETEVLVAIVTILRLPKTNRKRPLQRPVLPVLLLRVWSIVLEASLVLASLVAESVLLDLSLALVLEVLHSPACTSNKRTKRRPQRRAHLEGALRVGHDQDVVILTRRLLVAQSHLTST